MPNNNPTQTKAWKALEAHASAMRTVQIKDLFADNQKRFDEFHTETNGFLYDYSKNRVTSETIALLTQLAAETNLKASIDAMVAGEKINITEGRAALHMALRGCETDRENAAFITEQLGIIKSVSEKIRSEKNISDIVHIGTGGSDLGPRLICQALCHQQSGPNAHFINNIDAAEIQGTIKKLKPENTIFIIASKAFSTAETLLNARTAKAWLLQSMDEAKAMQDFYAVTQNNTAAAKLGIPADNILPLRDWIGGRFSLWSLIGLTIAINLGFDTFRKLLDGAAAMDKHFLEAPHDSNIPVLMALISLWHRNLCDYQAQAIIPYARNLHNFPSYIQQLEMESNGKSVDRQGQKIDYATAPVIFGDVGTNAQHAFFQLFHQGSTVIPCDFIIFKNSCYDLPDHNRMLICNALAQSEALMQGMDNKNEPHRHFDGNRPSSTFLLDKIDACNLGMLIAAYEHKIFVQGALWNINSFDQWGVELGKTLASRLITACETGKTPENLDSSTAGLLGKIKAKNTDKA